MDRPSTAVQLTPGSGDRQTPKEAAYTQATSFAAFGRAPAWEELPAWPPDDFCFCNRLLDHG